MQEKYNSPVVAMEILNMTREDSNDILKTVLFEFPIRQINLNISKWVCALSPDHWLLSDLMAKISAGMENVERVRDYSRLTNVMKETPYSLSLIHI